MTCENPDIHTIFDILWEIQGTGECYCHLPIHQKVLDVDSWDIFRLRNLFNDCWRLKESYS